MDNPVWLLKLSTLKQRNIRNESVFDINRINETFVFIKLVDIVCRAYAIALLGLMFFGNSSPMKPDVEVVTYKRSVLVYFSTTKFNFESFLRISVGAHAICQSRTVHGALCEIVEFGPNLASI